MSMFNSYSILRNYRKDPLRFIRQCFADNGHLTHLHVFGKELFVVSQPEHVVQVLKTNNARYSKGRTTKALQKFLGKGLITNEGDSWRKQHRLIRPIMNLKSIHELAPRIFDSCQAFLPEIERTNEINAFREMNRLTWRIILQTLFSQQVNSEMDDWLEEILQLMVLITHKTRSVVPLPFWVPTKKNRRLKRIIAKFDEYVYGLIEQRRKGEKKHDLIQLLMDAREEGIADMSDEEIRDEVMTFLMAGHETITNSLSWTLIEIARHPEYFKELQQEADQFFENKDYAYLNSAPWLGAVIDEAMRLWPAVWVFMRQAEEADQIEDLKIPVGANVVLAPFLTHRAPDLWSDPDKFRPERFLPEQKKNIRPGAFYPFGLGARACIGSYFAGMEARIILANLVRHFEWELVKEEVQTCGAEITLRPTNNVMMRFRRR